MRDISCVVRRVCVEGVVFYFYGTASGQPLFVGVGSLYLAHTNDIKKADVTTCQWACGHVGLLFTSPPCESEVTLYFVVRTHGLHHLYPRRVLNVTLKYKTTK